MNDLHAKLRANRHRRQREQFIRNANPAFASILKSADIVTGIDVDSWVSGVPWPTFVDSKLTTTQGDLEDSTFTDWDDRAQVANAFRAIPNPPAVDAHLFLDNDGPLFRISLGYFHRLMEHILEFSQAHHESDFAWVSEDGKHGVLLSTYCGYLPEERRTTLPEEVVYEILHWGI